MGYVFEIIVDGLKKFGGEIVAAILLALAFGLFPGMRSLFKYKVQNQEEERLKSELKQKEEALKQAEAQKAEEARRRAEIERELEEQLHVLKAQNIRESPYITRLKSDAERGDVSSQYELGEIYRKGNEVERNERKAIKYYRMAAKQGHSAAQ
ncbi:MAG: SEL1-like repeat protein, partial [Synergistaceae bacterium]|nr:SEL1-like repeat protein [Synergistaceae bacterium]